MSIEITEEEISAELGQIRTTYLTAVNLLSEDELRRAAVHRVYWHKKKELDKHVDTSDKRE